MEVPVFEYWNHYLRLRYASVVKSGSKYEKRSHEFKAESSTGVVRECYILPKVSLRAQIVVIIAGTIITRHDMKLDKRLKLQSMKIRCYIVSELVLSPATRDAFCVLRCFFLLFHNGCKQWAFAHQSVWSSPSILLQSSPVAEQLLRVV